MNIALIGSGRMGRMLESLCEKDEGLHVAGFVGRTQSRKGCIFFILQSSNAVDFRAPGAKSALVQ